MNARAAGEVECVRRQTSATGRHTRGCRLRTSTGGPSRLVSDRGRIAAGAVQFGEDPPGTGGHGTTCLGDDDPAAGPLEQQRPQLAFELPDLVRQRRLRDVQLLGGAGEVAVSRHGLDAPQLPYLHGSIVEHDCCYSNNELLW